MECQYPPDAANMAIKNNVWIKKGFSIMKVDYNINLINSKFGQIIFCPNFRRAFLRII